MFHGSLSPVVVSDPGQANSIRGGDHCKSHRKVGCRFRKLEIVVIEQTNELNISYILERVQRILLLFKDTVDNSGIKI